MRNTIWTENIHIPRFEEISGDRKTDVLIVGGGIAGLLCAHALKERGLDNIVMEADRILHGVTRNTTAKLTSQHGLIYHKIAAKYGKEAAKLYWQANEDAIGKYRILSDRIPCEMEQKNNYIYSINNRRILEKEMTVLRELGIPAELTDTGELPFPAAGAVCFREQGQFHPLKLLTGIAKDLNIYENTAAKEFAPNEVITDRGKIRAEKIIIATHFPILNKHGMYFLKMYQDRSYVLALENSSPLDGMYLDESEKGMSFRSWGNTLLIGCGSHRTGKKTDGWAAAEEYAKEYHPDAKILSRWATQDCMTLDGLPYIGQYSEKTPDLYVATGFNKWGMTTAMAGATLLADLVKGKANPCENLFSPSRSMLHPKLLINGVEASCGLLRPTKHRCSHLGCALRWNPLERSWDCGCHGSRFSEDGKLENGPATGDIRLDQI